MEKMIQPNKKPILTRKMKQTVKQYIDKLINEHENKSYKEVREKNESDHMSIFIQVCKILDIQIIIRNKTKTKILGGEYYCSSQCKPRIYITRGYKKDYIIWHELAHAIDDACGYMGDKLGEISNDGVEIDRASEIVAELSSSITRKICFDSDNGYDEAYKYIYDICGADSNEINKQRKRIAHIVDIMYKAISFERISKP